MQLHIFGIRHHGPGSARRLLQALNSLEPDIILIEGPPDADDQIALCTEAGLNPPVALLVYNPKNLKQAAYYPFAGFSPEWQAMRFATERNIPVRFMDMPQSMHFYLQDQKESERQLAIEISKKANTRRGTDQQLRDDPLGFMARLAGYTDSERWWEQTFEQYDSEQLFAVIHEMMSALREETDADMSDEDHRREACMREIIRKAQKEGFQRIAVVCGAWHAPALEKVDTIKSAHDKKILKGIRKVKTHATWVPWTYERLATVSGYRAGVVSPAYYQLLYTHPGSVVSRWMTMVARQLRKHDLDASSAHSIESVRLASTLATLRGLPVPGLAEMREAAISIFCEGDDTQLDLISNQLVIGNAFGSVPPSVPIIPLQRDLEANIKSARLTKERKTADVVEKKLDLRVDSNLLASHLLHRLNLLDIDWGWEQQVRKFGLAGSFHEHWKLKWKPDFVLQIIEAGMWGNKVKEAAGNYVDHLRQQIKSLPEMTRLVDRSLKADLPDQMERLVDSLRSLSARTKEVTHLMQALPPLVNAIRYGSTRQLDVSAMNTLIHEMVPRILIGLPGACSQLEEEASKVLFDTILDVHRAIQLIETEEYVHAWHDTLHKVADLENVHGLIRGGVTRLLFDREAIDLKEASRQMYFALSTGNEPADAAAWLEGFLHGSGLLLIHHPDLWNILDGWLSELAWPVFKELLPLLRRSFAEFSPPERRKMLDLAKRELVPGQQSRQEGLEQTEVVEKRGKKVLPVLRILLGRKNTEG